MPNEVGVRVIQETIASTIVPASAELPTCIVGPLYEVFVSEPSDVGFDPLEVSNTPIPWPNKRIGTVVDLTGTRNGYIDSQRRRGAKLIPKVELVDGPVVHVVADSNIEGIDQDGLEIKQDARNGLERGAYHFHSMDVNGEIVLYNPAGGLASIRAGDRFAYGPDPMTVVSSSDTRIQVAEPLGSPDAKSRVAQDEGNLDVGVTPAVTAGRVIVTLNGAGHNFAASQSVGDAAVTYVPMNGLSALQGQIDGSPSGTTDINGLTFGVGVTLDDVENYLVRVVNYDTDGTYTSVDTVFFAKVVDIDTVAGTITVDDEVDVTGNDDYVEITILKGQVGYIEDINYPVGNQATIVVPDVFSDSLAVVDFYQFDNPPPTMVYPDFSVRVSYRALRKDLANIGYTARQASDILDVTGHGSIDYRDELGFATRLATLAQPTARDVFFVPVDIEPDGTTGLPGNYDRLGGYVEALEAVEALEVYNIVTLDRGPSIEAAVESHVTSLSNEVENSWRRGFFIEKVPLGATESSLGEISPGRVPGGIATSPTAGNAVIRDASVDFVTSAGVVAGTKVVITSPPELAGEHTALASSTDNDLILELEGGKQAFEVIKEFEVAGPLELDTISSNTHLLSGSVPTGTWVHVEPGDYLEVTENSTVYRLRVLAVNASGTQLTCTDDVPGVLDFGTSNSGNATDAAVIRTWGPNNLPSVEYHIRPLTRAQQVDAIVANQTRANRRFTVTLDHSPTIEVSDGQFMELDPALTLCAIAAKRSGLRSFDETTNLVLGGGIVSCKYAYETFRRAYKKVLSDAGITLISQRSPTSEPYIADHITSDTSSLVTQEEIVTANGDWMSIALRRSYQAAPGQQLPILTQRLIGLRVIQIDAILNAWKDEGRLIDYSIVGVQRNELNKRQLDIVLRWVMPVAEKEIEFTVQLTV